MKVANVIPCSLNNGDGLRMVIAFSGCSLNCDGCFSKELQSFDYGKEVNYKTLAKITIKQFLDNKMLDGLTLSGGNPIEQPELSLFIEEVKDKIPNLNIWLWTGNLFEEIDDKILKLVDVIIDGKFIKSKQVENEYYGSSNQKVWRKNKEGNWIGDKNKNRKT